MLYDLINKLTKELKLDPEQQFKVTAAIKREIHLEKVSLYHRLFLLTKGVPVFDEKGTIVTHKAPDDPFIHSLLKDKFENHLEWALKSDEDIVTWSVGSHVYIQKIEPCSVCGKELTGKPYTRIIDKNKNSTFCCDHTPPNNYE